MFPYRCSYTVDMVFLHLRHGVSSSSVTLGHDPPLGIVNQPGTLLPCPSPLLVTVMEAWIKLG